MISLRRLASCLADADPAVATGWFQLETMLPSDSHGNTGELHGLQVEAEPLPTEHASSLDKAFNAMQARMAQFEQVSHHLELSPKQRMDSLIDR